MQNLSRSNSWGNLNKLVGNKERFKDKKAAGADKVAEFHASAVKRAPDMSGARRGSTGFADGQEGGTIGHLSTHHAIRTSSLAYSLCDSPFLGKNGISNSGKQKTFVTRRGSAGSGSDLLEELTSPVAGKKKKTHGAISRLLNKGGESNKANGKTGDVLAPGKLAGDSAAARGFCGEDVQHRVDTAVKLLPLLAQV